MFLLSHFPWPLSISSQSTEVTRYYYSKEKLFEKSLDVYKPIFLDGDEKQAAQNLDLPVVIMVVGSGWIGHRAVIYAQTSWWNSSGPKSVASLGHTCVCIRHRGAFCVMPPFRILGQYLAVLCAIFLVFVNWEIALAITLFLAFVASLLALGGEGSASFQDMLEDVAEALRWIEDHREVLRFGKTRDGPRPGVAKSSSSSSRGDNENSTGMPSMTSSPSNSPPSTPSTLASGSDARQNIGDRPSYVFGGYSSGGHVAATLLHRPELFTKYGLPHPEKLFDAILMISGVLAVRPEQLNVTSSQIPEEKAVSIGVCGPMWLINFVMQFVWGSAALTIPSPLILTNPPRLPHLLIGCRDELFGLPWLKVFFCSNAYAEKIKVMTGQHATHVEVESDHWRILNSSALRKVLREELTKLISNNPRGSLISFIEQESNLEH